MRCLQARIRPSARPSTLACLGVACVLAHPVNAEFPFLAHEATGQGSAQRVDEGTPVFDSDATTDLQDTLMTFEACTEEAYAVCARGLSRVDQGAVSIHLRVYFHLDGDVYAAGPQAMSGTLDSILEFAMPARHLEWTYEYFLNDSASEGEPRSATLTVENASQGATLLQLFEPQAETDMTLSGNVGDVIRITTQASGKISANSSLFRFDVDFRASACNASGALDIHDIVNGTSSDCNGNDVPDECEISDAGSLDCDVNGVLDQCETNVVCDCNENNVPDDQDIAGGASEDCNDNGIPDECADHERDCNANLFPDACDLVVGSSSDCNANDIPDVCDLVPFPET